MPLSRSIPLAATLLSLTAASGCGFLLTQGPPTGHEQLEFIPCTESDAGPILDLVWVGLNIVGVVMILTTPEEYTNRELSVASGLGWGILSGASAASGFKKAKACKNARQALAIRQAARRLDAVPVGDSIMVMAVVISPAADTLAVGAQQQLVAAAHTSSGAVVAGRMFTWSSSNDAIASVSNAGLVTARAPGSVLIAANTSNVVGTARIVVRP
jgi:uncharacterized protein YjdB